MKFIPLYLAWAILGLMWYRVGRSETMLVFALGFGVILVIMAVPYLVLSGGV